MRKDGRQMDIRLRPMEESDFDPYISLQKEVYFDPSLVETDKQKSYIWDGVVNGKGCYYAIVESKDQHFLGYCSIKDRGEEIPEISIELLKKYRNKGVGYQAVCNLMREIESIYHKNVFLYKVEPDNYESLMLVRKLKGRPKGLERSRFLSDEYVPVFETASAGLIDEKMEEIARAFQCDAIKLLSHVLVFQIRLEDIDDENIVCFGMHSGEIHSERKLSKSIRAFEQLMWLEKIMDALESDDADRNAKLSQVKVELQEKIGTIKQLERKHEL